MSRRTHRHRHGWWSEEDFWREQIRTARPGKWRRRLIRRRNTARWIARVRLGRVPRPARGDSLPITLMLVLALVLMLALATTNALHP